jgi:pSer/pThr/pTyr-binding forkhead associated (FHA) protein
MSFAKFIVIQPGRATRELMFDGGVTSIGRALDNTISLDGDTNVSRYHAEIEKRAEGFWITDLGSSNGTTVNDIPVDLDRSIRDGDLIGIGGSSIIEFHVSDQPFEDESRRVEEPEPPPPAPAYEPPAVSVPAAPSVGSVMPSTPSVSSVVPGSSSLSPFYLIGAIAGGLLLTAAVAGIFLFTRSSACKASVRIISPQNGTTVRGPLPIQVEAEETECIDRVIYQLDGVKVASSEVAPYQAMLDPADLSGLTPGNHVLTVTIEDEKGNRSVQPEEVVLGFDKSQASAPEVPTETNQTTGSNNEPGPESPRSLSASDIKDMSEKLAREVSKKGDYIFDRELLHQIEARTREYAVSGFHARARPFRDVINDSFINEQGLDPPLGYLIAMSRSNFSLTPSRAEKSPGEGLWRMPTQLAQEAGYVGRCGTATLSDANQKCAAMAAAAYTKALVVDLFFGDTLYAIACFGMNPKEAAQWRDQLPTDRRDLWKVVNSPEQRDRLIRFFAAGIVGENPQQFGLTADTPLSSLYPKK